MAHPRRQRDALQIIFAFFLGLMVTAFLGLGVYTFHPSPSPPLEARSEELRDAQLQLRHGRAETELDSSERARLEALEHELRQIDRERREQQEAWARSSSIILMVLATAAMGLSLIRAEPLPVISNGLLLGGVFTMLYGTGWTLASGESQLRFWVITVALVITLGLGWLRFVRAAAASSGVTPATRPETTVPDLEARVAELERRWNAAGNAFRGDDD